MAERDIDGKGLPVMTPTPIKFIVGDETFEAFIEGISHKEQYPEPRGLNHVPTCL